MNLSFALEQIDGAFDSIGGIGFNHPTTKLGEALFRFFFGILNGGAGDSHVAGSLGAGHPGGFAGTLGEFRQPAFINCFRLWHRLTVKIVAEAGEIFLEMFSVILNIDRP